MKIDINYSEELKKLKRKENLLVVAAGAGVGALLTVFKYIGRKECSLRALEKLDKIIESMPKDKE